MSDSKDMEPQINIEQLKRLTPKLRIKCNYDIKQDNLNNKNVKQLYKIADNNNMKWIMNHLSSARKTRFTLIINEYLFINVTSIL